MLYLSNGSTEVISYADDKNHSIAENIYIYFAIWNFLDSFSFVVSLANDSTPVYSIELTTWKTGNQPNSRNFIHLPYYVKEIDWSFSAMLQFIEQENKQAVKSTESIEDLCSSLQGCIFTMLVEVAVWAMAQCGPAVIQCIGGLQFNLLLQ